MRFLLGLCLVFAANIALADGAQTRALLQKIAEVLVRDDQTTEIQQIRDVLLANQPALLYMLNHPNPRAIPDEAGLADAAGQIPSFLQGMIDALISLRPIIPEDAREEGLRLAIEHCPEHFLSLAASAIRDAVAKYDPTTHPMVKALFDAKRGLQHPNPAYARLFNEIFPEYLRRMTIKSRLRVAAGVLKLQPDATPEQKIARAVVSLPVAVQKMFQQFGDYFQDPVIRTALALVKSEIEPLPPTEISAIVRRNLGSELADAEDLRGISSGTVGQVAFIGSGFNTKVLKILRPGVDESLMDDLAIFMELLADDPQLQTIVRLLFEKFIEETDLLREHRQTVAAQFYRSPRRRLEVARVNANYPATKEVIVLELVPGMAFDKIKLDELSTKDLRLLRDSIIALVATWFRKAIFDFKLFHGDPHGGNLFYDNDPTSPTYRTLTIFDLGQAPELSGNESEAFIRIAIGAFWGRPTSMANGIAKMSAMDAATRAEVLEVATTAVRLHQRLDQRLTYFFEKIPARLLTGNMAIFYRGLDMLEAAITKVEAELAKRKVAGKYGRSAIVAWSSLQSFFESSSVLKRPLRVLVSECLSGCAAYFCGNSVASEPEAKATGI